MRRAIHPHLRGSAESLLQEAWQSQRSAGARWPLPVALPRCQARHSLPLDERCQQMHLLMVLHLLPRLPDCSIQLLGLRLHLHVSHSYCTMRTSTHAG